MLQWLFQFLPGGRWLLGFFRSQSAPASAGMPGIADYDT